MMAASMDDSLQETFERAADHLSTVASTLDSEKLLYLYARYKQAIDGPCNISKPGFFNFQAKQKWEAWNSLENMSSIQAMKEYIKEITHLDPKWNAKEPSDGMSKGFGLAVSTLRGEAGDTVVDDLKTIFDWIKDGNVSHVNDILSGGQSDPNEVDDEFYLQGMALLHWASDRGHVEMVDLLLKHGARVNLQDADGQTALHYASSCGHADAIKSLIVAGADISIEDNESMTPADVAMDHNTASLINR